MKKKKWIVLTIIIIFVIALATFGFLKLKQNIKKDKEMTKQNITSITKFYDEFNDLAISFNEKSQNLTEQISNTFFTNLKTEKEKLENILKELEQILDNMDMISKELNGLCKATYLDATINRNCSSYQISLDSANLVYKDTIEHYNDLIRQYNDWAKENAGYEEIEYYNGDRN